MRIDEVIVPANLNEALAALKRNPDATLFAGGTELLSEEATESPKKTATLISLHSIPELRHVSRTDHYLEVGAMTTLTELINLKEGFLPETLREVLRTIGTFAVRNLATLGGNLSNPGRFRDCFPVLACMDASAEFRQGSTSRWVNINRLVNDQGLPAPPRGELLTRIRIPLAEWSLGMAHKLGLPGINSSRSGLFVILVRTEKRALSDIRIFHSCERAIRRREIESALIGKKIPLPARDVDSALGSYAAYCTNSGLAESSAVRFLALVRKAFNLLDDGTLP